MRGGQRFWLAVRRVNSVALVKCMQISTSCRIVRLIAANCRNRNATVDNRICNGVIYAIDVNGIRCARAGNANALVRVHAGQRTSHTKCVVKM